MKSQDVFDRYCQAAPFAVLVQLVIRRFIEEEFDELFELHRGTQYEGRLSFSDFALAVADVALGFCDNPNQAYRKHKESLGVQRSSFYDKLNRTDPGLSEAIVASSARVAKQIQDALGFVQWEALRGYRVVSVDGCHLSKSEKRLEPLRGTTSAPLPGTAVARFDLGRQLFDEVYLLEDAHAQETRVLDRVIDDLEEGDVLIGDRIYCVVDALEDLMDKSCLFAIRQHGRLKGVSQDRRRMVGRTSSGTVHEEKLRCGKDENSPVVRRITIKLKKPTRDGDTEIHILTNLPEDVSAREIADLYLRRWEQETGFYHVKMCFNGELPAMGHPRAALLLYCMATMAYNVLQAVLSALYATHEDEQVDELSFFHISKEIASNTPGMLLILDDDAWEEVLPTTSRSLAAMMRRIAGRIDLSEYRKSRRGEKKKYKRKSNSRSKHVATARLLAAE